MGQAVLSWLILLVTVVGFSGVFATDDFNTVVKQSQNGDKVLVCYYQRSRRLPASSVPSNLCTHIIYAFGRMSPKGITPVSSSDVETYRTLISLKKQNPALKVMISLQHDFSSVVDKGIPAMKSFSGMAVAFLAKYGFDGVDLDWEFPSSSQKDAFSDFIQIFSSSLRSSNFLLSMALPNAPIWFTRGFDATTINRYVDLMTVMAYDFHMYIKDRDNTTGYQSALIAPRGELSSFSGQGMIDFYISKGMTSSKLLLGIPTYGRSWTLADPKHFQLHSPAVGKGQPAPYSGLSGLYLFADVCVAVNQGAEIVKDDQSVAQFIHLGTSWVAYESVFTVAEKASWVQLKGLGGVGVWALQIDDGQNVCGMGTLPLVTTIRSHL